MYCPNCATKASTEQKFCRVCGMELQAVSELLSSNPGFAPRARNEGTLQPRQRATLIWGFITTFGAVGVGAGLKILGKQNIYPAGEFTPYISVLGVLVAFFGLALMSLAFLEMMSPKRKSRGASSPSAEPTAELHPALLHKEPLSVTEQTTELLETSESRTVTRDTTAQDMDR